MARQTKGQTGEPPLVLKRRERPELPPVARQDVATTEMVVRAMQQRQALHVSSALARQWDEFEKRNYKAAPAVSVAAPSGEEMAYVMEFALSVARREREAVLAIVSAHLREAVRDVQRVLSNGTEAYEEGSIQTLLCDVGTLWDDIWAAVQRERAPITGEAR
jgi:hypothetical protein